MSKAPPKKRMKKENPPPKSGGELLSKNQELWARFSPRAAMLLPYHDSESLEVTKSADGQLNLFDPRHKRFYHDPTSPLEEAKRWFSSLTLHSQTHALYLYGVGMGYAYDAAKPWLDQADNRQIVFLEDDLTVIYHLLSSPRGSLLLKDPRVHLYYFKDLKESEEILDQIFWQFILSRIEVSALQLYKETKPEQFIALKSKTEYDVAMKNASLDEYLRFGGAFFLNFYPNMAEVDQSLSLARLFGTFHNVPAIICGAGPSLTHHLPLLGSLSERALIFAGGSSINALSSHGLLPHFGAGIDPNPTQLDRLSNHNGFEVPYFYRNRLLRGAFQLIHGPRIYVNGSGGYDIAAWFEEEVGIPPLPHDIEEGHNVVNLCVEVAKALGCNPILLIGMDLSYTNMQAYAKGIVEDATVSEEGLISQGDYDADAILRPDIHGKQVYTHWKWIAESDWFSEYAQAHPEVTIINCTEAGIGMGSVPNIPFQKAVDEWLFEEWDLTGRIAGLLEQCTMSHVTKEKIVTAMKKLKESLDRLVVLFQTMIDEQIPLRSRLRAAKTKDSYTTQTGASALAEIEIEEEVAYHAIIEIFNSVYNQAIQREITLQRAKAKNWKQLENKKLDIAEHKYTFLKTLAAFNSAAITKTLAGEL